MIKSQSQYSYWMKRLQIGAIILGAAVVLFGSLKLFSHVEVHIHRTPEMDRMEEILEDEKDLKEYQKACEGEKHDTKRVARYFEKQMG